MYIPTTINNPMIEEKGDGQIELSASTNSALIATSYAFTNKFAAIGSFSMSYGNFSDRYDIFTDKEDGAADGIIIDYDEGQFSHRYGEIGLGMYNLLNNQKTSRKPIQLLEVFAGFGYGKANDNIPKEDTSYNCDVNYQSYFIQGNYGISNKYFDLGIALKLAGSFFHYTSGDYIQAGSYIQNNNNSGLTGIEYKKVEGDIRFSMIHVEPMFFVRGGFQNLKYKFQVGVVPNYKSQSNDSYSTYGFNNHTANITWIHMSMGLTYNFNFLKKKDIPQYEY